MEVNFLPLIEEGVTIEPDVNWKERLLNMMRMKSCRRTLSFLLILALLWSVVRLPSFAGTMYLPDVTADMAKPSYW